jgi:hypothetical protein
MVVYVQPDRRQDSTASLKYMRSPLGAWFSCRAAVTILLLSFAQTGAVRADGDDLAAENPRSAAASARDGMLLQFTLAPKVDVQRALVTSAAGYDSARRSAVAQSATEMHAWGPISVRGGVEYSQTGNSLRPSVGLKVQAFDQQRHGIDGAIAVFYKAEGFSQAEGEVEAVLALARRFNHFAAFANVAYGQDPEAAERDGELRLGGVASLTSRLITGLDARFRFDLGSDAGKRRAKLEASYDVVAGPTAAYAFGPVALVGQAGVSMVKLDTSTALRAGLIAVGGIGAIF